MPKQSILSFCNCTVVEKFSCKLVAVKSELSVYTDDTVQSTVTHLFWALLIFAILTICVTVDLNVSSGK